MIPHAFADRVGAVTGPERGYLDDNFFALINGFPTVINAQAFGALGNGAHDDAPAIQAAINFAELHTDPATYGSGTPSLGTVVVFIPAGQYSLQSQLSITKRVTLLGEGSAETSSGTRLNQGFTGDLVLISPAAQGMSFCMRDISFESGAPGTTGYLVKCVRGASNGANSCRFQNCVFFNPQGGAVLVSGDDWSFTDCTFDVSIRGGGSIQLGDAAASEVASNCRFVNCNWFNCVTRCFLGERWTNVTITGCTVSQASGSNTQWFFDAGNAPPPAGFGNALHVSGCTVEGVQQALFLGPNCTNTSFVANVCFNSGAGSGSTLDFIHIQAGGVSDLTITGNRLHGNVGGMSFYNDSGLSVTSLLLAGNTITTTGAGAGQVLQCSASTGDIRDNVITGAALQSVSEKRATTGTPFAPGTVAAGGVVTVTVTINSARLGDGVFLLPVTGAWPAPAGITLVGWISAANTLSVSYRNNTAAGIFVAAHDLIIEVYR